MLNIKIKKLVPEAVIPAYTKVGDAGMDVYAISKYETNKFVEYGTGLAFEVPEGYVLLVFARSSVSNTNLILANSVGVLDSGYRGELKLRFRKIGTEDYQLGERVGQIIVLPYPQVNFEEVTELSNTERGVGGFGSSGKN
jgi:dUTP pyrophosphatase